MLLSIRGLYNYRPTIFNDFQVPSGMNKQAAIADILLACSELSVVYPDPEMMEEAIKWWTLTELENWTRAWNALQLEYNPIWNVDGTVEETEERDLANSESRSYESETTGSRTGSETTGSETDETSGNTRTNNLAHGETTVNGVSGFNIQQGFTDADNTVVSGTDTGSVTDAGTDHSETTGTRSNTESTTENKEDSETRTGTDTGTVTRTTRRTGNIGVTTSQQMLKEELEIAEVNIYHQITNSFKHRFCVMVY